VIIVANREAVVMKMTSVRSCQAAWRFIEEASLT
jgi:hypothetical protein